MATSLTHGRGGGGHLWSRGNHLLQLVDTRACQHALLGYAGLTSSLTSHTQLDVTCKIKKHLTLGICTLHRCPSHEVSLLLCLFASLTFRALKPL